MTETPDTLPERLRHTHPEAAEHIALLRRTLHAIVEMIDDCPDAPRGSDSLPGAIRFYADGALRGIDTGVK